MRIKPISKNMDLSEFSSDKILEINDAVSLINSLKSKNKKIGLCHGGFDLLHPGHIKHFESAKKLCDILFVSITSDHYIAIRKGKNRPIYNDTLRAYAVASVRFVDYVVISDSKTGISIIKRLLPDYYIKGPDYVADASSELMQEKEAAESCGGRLIFTKDPKLSTTDILRKIKNLDMF